MSVSEVTDWIALVAMVPLMVVTLAAWGIILWGKRDPEGRRKARAGAWILTAMTVVVGVKAIAGWVVPDALAWSLVGAGLVLGAGAAWYLMSPSRGK